MWPKNEGFFKASFCTHHKQFEKQQKSPKKKCSERKKITWKKNKNKKHVQKNVM
jgi:hypothetical protein